MNTDKNEFDLSSSVSICAPSVANHSLPIPAPRARVEIAVRVATMDDLPFLDSLQKQHSKALGFFPRAQMEGYIENGWVLIAEDAATKQPVGYCASRDRYLKRDELGVIYQLCVVPGDQRKLVGASLIKAVFERSAYGCRLYCCWCAQDLEANYFWESLGFVPIAFRGGSGKKKRVHIFWQRRIDPVTPSPNHPITPAPYWFPSKTDQGAMREDRLVLPIPPGLHWSDPMPVMAVQAPAVGGELAVARGEAREMKRPRRVAKPELMAGPVKHGPRQYGGPPPVQVPVNTTAQQSAEKIAEKKERPKQEKAKVDPKLIAKARELRDRYLEHVNGSPDALPAPGARYDVTRALPQPAGTGTMHIEAQPLRQLPSAA